MDSKTGMIVGLLLSISVSCGDAPTTSQGGVSAESSKALTMDQRRDAYKSFIGTSAGTAVRTEGSPETSASDDQSSADAATAGDCPSSIPLDPALLDPSKWQGESPEQYTVALETTGGEIRIEVHRDWAPLGADRFYNLVSSGYLTEIAWFRVVPGFVAQAGMHGNPQIHQAWSAARIDDDPVLQTNARGMVTFATSGPNSRSNQFFINFGDNKSLDGQGFSPFGKVVAGMEIVDAIESKYGQSPNQGMIQSGGAGYLCSSFPDLDRILTARVVEDE